MMLTRREVLLAGASISVAALAISGSQPAEAASECFWNIAATPDLDPGFWTYAPALETKLGRKFAGFRWNAVQAAMPHLDQYNQAYDYGWHWAYVNGKPSPPSGSYAGYWRATANGTYDSFWKSYFAAVKADTRWTSTKPLHFSYHHEQSVTTEGGGLTNGPPSDYIAAYRHVRGLLDAAGAHASQGGNMVACWVPMWTQFANPSNPFYAPKCDPGSQFYDVIGQDAYLKSTASFTAKQQYQPLHDYAVKVGKPWITGEMGVAGSDAKVVAYLKQLDSLLKGWGAGSGPGQVLGLCWTSRVASGGDYRMDATTTRLAQYKAMAHDSFYGAVT